MPFTFRAPQRLLNNLALIVPDEVYFIMLGSLCDKVRVAQSLVFCVVFCRSLFVLFLPVSFDHCIVCLCSIYGF
jgi:hypothetical protein